jgi:uncharacterized membrane protein YphA (DoxX/SURF4 family)
MKIATLIIRLLLGLAFVVFGLNGFLQFMKGQPEGEHARQFVGAMSATGYFKVVAGLQIVGGALLLWGRYQALGLLLLGPIVVNIVLFHVFLEPKGLPIAIVFGVLSLFLLWRNSAAFAGFCRPTTGP